MGNIPGHLWLEDLGLIIHVSYALISVVSSREARDRYRSVVMRIWAAGISGGHTLRGRKHVVLDLSLRLDGSLASGN